MDYQRETDKIFVTLDKGEFINESLLKVAQQEKINTGWISGIGAVEEIEVGYYDLSAKCYQKRKFPGEHELTGLIGNVTEKDGGLFVHTHITFCDTEFRGFGGHLFDARITAAGEFIIYPGKTRINRKFNKEIGMALWCFNHDHA